MKNLSLFLICAFLMSCASTDEQEKPPVVFPEPEIIYIEKPVFIPEKEAQSRTPSAGVNTVSESNAKGIIKPENYSHAAIVYNYNPDWVYEVYSQPLRANDIVMEAGEQLVEPPFVSDSERWIIGAGVSYENGTPVQHVYVKPEKSGISATLIINTNMRVYRIILRSYSETHMPIVRWRYSAGMPNTYIKLLQNNSSGQSENINIIEDEKDFPPVDPRYLSYNYRITAGLFRRPAWKPTLVFDDGEKTYINFPDSVLKREFPAVFENRKDIVNYRVTGNFIIIDKLIEKLTVKIGRGEVNIVKKRGKNVRP